MRAAIFPGGSGRRRPPIFTIPRTGQSQSLEVALWLPTNYDFKIFPALIPELKEAIRHELEHGSQATEKLESGKEVLSLKGEESEQFKDPKALADFYTTGWRAGGLCHWSL